MLITAMVSSFLVVLLGCAIYLQVPARWRLLDRPNARSAHTEPTPHGGGIVLFAGVLAGGLVLWSVEPGLPAVYLRLFALALILVVAGIVDDRYNLAVQLRLPLYAVCCTVMVVWVASPAPVWLLALAAFYALWILNLFNFMDGIDGIAATEAIFALLIAAALSYWWSGAVFYPVVCLVLASASMGFLHWNWAPARLFMGDAGSVPLGFLLAALSLLGEAEGVLPLVVWLILLAVFVADATFTLFWRAWQGEKITQAHSRHLYQRLARYWQSHARVVLCLMAYNLLWLLPLAVLVMWRPDWQWLVLLAAYLPLLPILLKADKLP